MVRWAILLAAHAIRLLALALVAAFAAFGPGFVRAPSDAQIRALVAHGQLRLFPRRDGGEGGQCQLPLAVTLAEIAPAVVKALIAAEDRRFHEHAGVDPVAITRALAANLLGRPRQGGSTLTQQLVKNLLFEAEDEGWVRKLLEAPIALRFEQALSKPEILTAYLNHAYFAGGVIGIEAAARHFYGKTARQLNVLESAVLVGMLKAPRDYSPIHHHDRALKRARVVLNRQIAAGLLKPGEVDAALRQGERPGREALYELGCEHFRDWVLASLPIRPPPEGRLRVVVTLDAWDQAELVYAVDRALVAGRARGASQVAAVHMSRKGEVRALVGGAEYGQSQFNRAVAARRSPGSTAKLFLYAEACRQGWKSQDRLLDAPVTADGWPANADGTHWGPISLYRSFVWSRNGSAAHLEAAVGAAAVVAAAHRFGLAGDIPSGRGVSLGAFGATPLEMTAAYAVVANGGRRVAPTGIVAVIGPMGRILHWRRPAPQPRVLTRACAEQMRLLLRAAVREGTGREANIGPGVIGKTGTSDDYRDAWFIGAADEAVIGVWLGNDDSAPMRGISGGTIPAALFRGYAQVLTGEPDHRRAGRRKAPPLPPQRLATARP